MPCSVFIRIIGHADFHPGHAATGGSQVERALAAYADVRGGGELREMMNIAGAVGKEKAGRAEFPASVLTMLRHECDAASRRHDTCLDHYHDRSVYVADKMPHDFHYLGLIQILFDGIGTIHAMSDTLDACLSMYLHPFPASHDYAIDL